MDMTGWEQNPELDLPLSVQARHLAEGAIPAALGATVLLFVMEHGLGVSISTPKEVLAVGIASLAGGMVAWEIGGLFKKNEQTS